LSNAAKSVDSISNKNGWTQLSETISFQPNQDLETKHDVNQKTMIDEATSHAYKRMLSSTTAYAHSLQYSEEEFDAYQIAWHLLGFYVDCNYQNDGGSCRRIVMFAAVS
jgi:hypothetical protein